MKTKERQKERQKKEEREGIEDWNYYMSQCLKIGFLFIVCGKPLTFSMGMNDVKNGTVTHGLTTSLWQLCVDSIQEEEQESNWEIEKIKRTTYARLRLILNVLNPYCLSKCQI